MASSKCVDECHVSVTSPLIGVEVQAESKLETLSSPRRLIRITAVSFAVLLACAAVWCVAHAPSCSSMRGNSITMSTAARAPVRFLSVGDWGRNGTYNQSLIAKQMGVVGHRLQAQFVSSTGDNFYEEGLTDVEAAEFKVSFSDIYTHTSLQVPWYAVLGNHDYYGNVLAQLHPSLAQRDRRWQAFRSMRMSLPLCEPTSGPSCSAYADIFMYDTTPLVRAYRTKKGHHLDWRGLNSNDWAMQEQSQLQELEGWLKASQARWKIVVGHHPVYSYGHHGSQQEMIERVLPLLERYGVDVYLNGHDHNIQHIKMENSPVNFFTSGGGSKAWRSDRPEVAPGLKYYWPGQGFGAVEVSYDACKVVFYGVHGEVLYSTVMGKPSGRDL